MTMDIDCSKIQQQSVVGALRQARERLDTAEDKLALDFSAVRRIDSSALTALEELAAIADRKGGRVSLKGVSIDIYKVLTLVKLASRFSFLN